MPGACRTRGRRTTGWPIACRCTRIWCVRPVSRRRRSSEMLGERALELEVGARLARVRRRRRPCACARAGRGRSAPRSCRCARAGGPRTSARYSRSISPLGERRAAARGGPPPSARRRAGRRCRGRGGGRCPARSGSPPASGGASSCASVPSRWPRAGCTTRPARLVDDEQVLVLVGDREAGVRRSRAAARHRCGVRERSARSASEQEQRRRA